MIKLCRTTSILISLTLVLVLVRRSGSFNFPSVNCDTDPEEDPAVTNLRNYLRINSAHPDTTEGYEKCVDWLKSQAQEIGLDYRFIDFRPENLFAVLLSWNGSEPNLESILLNSHLDVVAADPAKWDHDPYGACKDEFGTIYGRGIVDMKSATVGQLEAIRHLKRTGFRPRRTIHMSILPDEEISGRRGMGAFVNSTEFTQLKVAFDIDEAGSNPSSDTMTIVYGEKSVWQFNITVTGKAGHGSTLPIGTAGEKLQIVIDRLMEFRKSQLDLVNLGQPVENVTTLNLVRMGGGIGNNILPHELWASFDMRVRVKQPGWNYTDVEQMLDNIVKEAGEGTRLEYITKSLLWNETPIDSSNVWWTELLTTCSQMGVKCRADYLNGATDGKYVRDVGIPVLGVNPFLNTNRTAHEDNEKMNQVDFLDGINRFVTIIRNMASVPASIHP